MTNPPKDRVTWRDIDRYFREASLEEDEEESDYEFVFDETDDLDEPFTVPFDYGSDASEAADSGEATCA